MPKELDEEPSNAPSDQTPVHHHRRLPHEPRRRAERIDAENRGQLELVGVGAGDVARREMPNQHRQLCVGEAKRTASSGAHHESTIFDIQCMGK